MLYMYLNDYNIIEIPFEDNNMINLISGQITDEIKIIIKQCLESKLYSINYELKNNYDFNFIKKYNELIVNNIKGIIIGIECRFLYNLKDKVYKNIQLNIIKLKKDYLNNIKKEKILNKLQNEQINNTNIKNNNNLVSYIYLIQERENYMNNKNIYKFGKTTQEPDNKIKRLQSYKKGSRILMLIECNNENVNNIESEIREEFKKEFIKHIDGHEHFEGDPIKMKQIIYSKIMN